MTMARAHLVDPAVTRWYHCVTRCVRRAFLLGEGPEDRKKWIECPPSSACPLTALGRRLRRASIKDRRRRLGIPLGEKSNDRTQIMRDLLEDAGLHPAPGWLVDCGPRRKIVWQESPLTARPDHVTNCAQQIAQRMFALWNILANQGQVQEKELPRGIRDVAWIRLPCRVHATT